jgi:hypothetical protein
MTAGDGAEEKQAQGKREMAKPALLHSRTKANVHEKHKLGLFSSSEKENRGRSDHHAGLRLFSRRPAS